MGITRFVSAGIAVAAATFLLSEPAAASNPVTVRVMPSAATVSVGDGFDVQLRADLGDPVLGWGLDLGFDSAVISQSAALTLGSLWAPVYTVDSDGLAGLAFPGSVTGNDVLLATLHFTALSAGQASLMISRTPGDLAEGFPLDSAGFADLQFVPAVVTVVPEPSTMCLMALLGLSMKRRSRRV